MKYKNNIFHKKTQKKAKKQSKNGKKTPFFFQTAAHLPTKVRGRCFYYPWDVHPRDYRDRKIDVAHVRCRATESWMCGNVTDTLVKPLKQPYL